MTQKEGKQGMAFEEELKTLIERTKKNGTDTSYKESYEAINYNFDTYNSLTPNWYYKVLR